MDITPAEATQTRTLPHKISNINITDARTIEMVVTFATFNIGLYGDIPLTSKKRLFSLV
jgi:hypothetical protein